MFLSGNCAMSSATIESTTVDARFLRSIADCKLARVPTTMTSCIASLPGVVDDADVQLIRRALSAARASGRADEPALKVLEEAFLSPPTPGDTLRSELVTRVQQTSGPATAKGVEDTALYIYVPLASRNEVGGEPDRPIAAAHSRVHERNAHRARDWPRTLLAADTHDTKRSADVRARLDVLTTMPAEWVRHVTRWRRLNKPHRRVVRGKLTPDTNAEYLYYQTLFGLWPAPRPERRADDLPSREWLESSCRRLVDYMRKAAREAKTRTSWTETDPLYEKALLDFVGKTLTPTDDAHFLPDLARLTALTAHAGFQVALARLLLQCTAPGIPDIYQGSELWSFTLVDPDNRRPVDFDLRRALLDDVDGVLALCPTQRVPALAGMLRDWVDGRIKLLTTTAGLRLRRKDPELFLAGAYVPLATEITVDGDAIAFARMQEARALLFVAPRLCARMFTEDLQPPLGATWKTSRVLLPPELADRRFRHELTGAEIQPTTTADHSWLFLGEIFEHVPVGMLMSI